MSQTELDPEAETIDDDVTHVLGHSWFFDPHNVKVQISHGEVILTGVVRSEQERRMAAAAAWAHEDVTNVDNRLTVA